MNIKTDKWNDHEIRFVEMNEDCWWAMIEDVTKALGISKKEIYVADFALDVTNVEIDNESVALISEAGLLKLMFLTQNATPGEFLEWICDNFALFRKGFSLEGFQVLKVFDAMWHKEQSIKNVARCVEQAWSEATREEKEQAAKIADKVIATLIGGSKPVGVQRISSDMAKVRRTITKDAVFLNRMNDGLQTGYSIQEIEKKLCDMFTQILS